MKIIIKNHCIVTSLKSVTSHFLLTAFFLLHLICLTNAQNPTINASEILEKINKEQPVEIVGKTIIGDLDFTQLDKKYRGGSYGARNGVVKEFYTKLLAPLIIRDCTIKGQIITFSTEKKPGVLKENFVAFDDLVTFENCRFVKEVIFERLTFHQGIVIKDCQFEEDLVFNKVHFAKPPIMEGGNFEEQLKIKETNWNGVSDELPAPPQKPDIRSDVVLILKNSTLHNIEIKFDRTTWTLAPLGKSSLNTDIGTEIYLLKNGKKERLLLTVERKMDGQEFDVAKL